MEVVVRVMTGRVGEDKQFRERAAARPQLFPF